MSTYPRCSDHGRNEVPGCPVCYLAETPIPEQPPSKVQEKLVRDKMPEICNRNAAKFKDGWTPMNFRQAEPTEMDELLCAKIREESHELKETLDYGIKERKIEELADLYFVLDAICERHGIAPVEINYAKQEKYEKRGGFHSRIVWDGIK